MDQAELTERFCARPQGFAWFIGAGTSRSAGLPTATDVIWDMKRRYYCREENQEISRQDTQNAAVREKIQAFVEARGFPPQWADDEYTAYFEKIFGADKERQRRYLRAILSEEKVTLSIGNRVLGAFLALGITRVLFTTNFDSVVEKAIAAVAGMSVSAYHLEGAHNANQALNNEEFPLYCKLHGDFRYDSLKNLPADLAAQNQALSQCLVNAGTRYGFIVSGYSGRDKSVMDLFRSVLETPNPYPHGFYWTGMKGFSIPSPVEALLVDMRQRGVHAEYVPIETFDALLLRLWRNIDDKPAEMDARVRKSAPMPVSLSMPGVGRQKPIVRLNALPITSLPTRWQMLSFRAAKEWHELRAVRRLSEGRLILTKTDDVYCWGMAKEIRATFGSELVSIKDEDLPTGTSTFASPLIKSVMEEALCAALARGHPLLSRTTRTSAFLVCDPHATDKSKLDPLFRIVGKTSGIVPGLFAPPTEEHPHAEQVAWSEAARISIDEKGGKTWLLVDPDVWIWPPRARRLAAEFLDGRRQDRYNAKYNSLLDTWIKLVLGSAERDTQVIVSAFDQGEAAENPAFQIGSRTAFARRLVI